MIPFNTEIFDLFGCLWCQEFPSKEIDPLAHKPIFHPRSLEWKDVDGKRTLLSRRLEDSLHLALACHDIGNAPCKVITSFDLPIEYYKMSEVKELVS